MKCPVCGKTFEPSRISQKFCSAKCNKKYHSRISSERNKSPFMYKNDLTAGRD